MLEWDTEAHGSRWRMAPILRSVEGIFKDGQVVLLETPPVVGESRVIVTFLPAASPVSLRGCRIDEAQATSLRARLKSCTEDWQRPEMDVYETA